MDSGFDPAALMGFGTSLGDESEVVAVSDDELKRIAGAEVRRKCAGIKLAARIVGMATVGRDEPDDDVLLRQMQTLMSRLGVVRRAVLEATGVERGSGDFAAAFNVATNVAMDIVTEEWKWARVGGMPKVLGGGELAKLLELVAEDGPVFADVMEGGDMATLRQLCVLESLPKLWSVMNMFDYYQRDHEKVIARLAEAISEQAEYHSRLLYSDESPSFAVRAIVQRMYGVSGGLMCELYKDAAARDVERLRAMPDLDRSVMVAQYEQIGMGFDHIIRRHQQVMDRMLDTTNMIIEAQSMSSQPVEDDDGYVG